MASRLSFFSLGFVALGMDNLTAFTSKEFGEVMQCESPKNSFHMEGGDWTFVWNPSPGILWGDLLTSWEKGPRNERYIAFDYTFLSKSFKINNRSEIALEFGVASLPLTLWIQQTYKLTLPLPVATGCNKYWATLGFGGFYVYPWELVVYKSPGFDQAGWPPRHLDAVVKDLAWRIRFKPKVKTMSGEKAEDPQSLQLRLSVYFELRPVFGDEESTTSTTGKTTDTTTTTPKPYVRRRRDWKPDPKDVPLLVVKWCELYVFSRRICNIKVRCLADPHWVCWLKCLGDAATTVTTPSKSYEKMVVDNARVQRSSEMFFQRRRRTLRVPSGVLFDTPELEKLLSASERQRLKAFKASMAETQPVPPASISVQDGRCAESAIGGGCKCVDDCSQATWGQENHLDGRSYVCQRYGEQMEVIQQEVVSICAEGRQLVPGHEARGKLTQEGGIITSCRRGTLIGGSCNSDPSKGDDENGKPGFYASFADGNQFVCKGTGEMTEEPSRNAVARAHCLELADNEDIKVISAEGRELASAKCPEGYQVLGGGCRIIESWSGLVREMFPTADNTWECTFDSTETCPPDGEPCILSEAQAVCMAIVSF